MSEAKKCGKCGGLEVPDFIADLSDEEVTAWGAFQKLKEVNPELHEMLAAVVIAGVTVALGRMLGLAVPCDNDCATCPDAGKCSDQPASSRPVPDFN
jgi:hypothetical protein